MGKTGRLLVNKDSDQDLSVLVEVEQYSEEQKKLLNRS